MDKSFEKLINRILDGRYKIESVVGIGGMAYVLRAADLKNGSRPVAIKVLNEEFNRDENAVKRFMNESETISMVDSPNIVKIYDVAISDSLKYIVMEYIDGITLKDYIDKVGALGWKEAVHYVRQILTGLSHAHEKGIIHRDIKPQNVMLLRDGRVKVTDFGIAKGPSSENLTMTDKAIGTVNYISPEQASGNPVDKKSDVYSVGVMLYEMLTGKLPFTAESPVAVAMMQVNDTPANPRSINPQIPVGLEQIVLKAMSKKPEDRFNCAMSMEKALEYFVQNPTTVFSGVSSSGSSSDKNKDDNVYDASKHRSMFPIILGLTTSFFVVIICSLLYVFFSSGGTTQDGLASALDKMFGIEQNNSQEKKMEVEDFTGRIYNEEVVEEMEKKGYFVQEIKETGYANVEDGIIVNQMPEAGEIIIKHAKTGVTLYVNKNEQEVNKNMPDCVGSPKNSAIEQIVRKFGPVITKESIDIIEVFNESHAHGTVFDCIPQVGHEVDVENDTITLYVSKGKQMEMPEITEKTESEAKVILDAEGIRYSIDYVESEEEAGIVLSASIEAGTEVTSADTVVLTVTKKAFKRETEPDDETPSVSDSSTEADTTPTSENPPVVDNTPTVDNTPVTENTPVTDNAPSTENKPVVDNTPVAEEVTADNNTPAVENEPVVDNTPVVQEPATSGGVDALMGMRQDN